MARRPVYTLRNIILYPLMRCAKTENWHDGSEPQRVSSMYVRSDVTQCRYEVPSKIQIWIQTWILLPSTLAFETRQSYDALFCSHVYMGLNSSHHSYILTYIARIASRIRTSRCDTQQSDTTCDT